MTTEGQRQSVADVTFRVLDRNGLLYYLPLQEKQRIFAEVSAQCGTIDWFDFTDALSLVMRLLGDTYKLADQLRRVATDESRAIEMLGSNYPDLSKDVLRRAYACGWLLSRK